MKFVAAALVGTVLIGDAPQLSSAQCVGEQCSTLAGLVIRPGNDTDANAATKIVIDASALGTGITLRFRHQPVAEIENFLVMSQGADCPDGNCTVLCPQIVVTPQRVSQRICTGGAAPGGGGGARPITEDEWMGGGGGGQPPPPPDTNFTSSPSSAPQVEIPEGTDPEIQARDLSMILGDFMYYQNNCDSAGVEISASSSTANGEWTAALFGSCFGPWRCDCGETCVTETGELGQCAEDRASCISSTVEVNCSNAKPDYEYLYPSTNPGGGSPSGSPESVVDSPVTCVCGEECTMKDETGADAGTGLCGEDQVTCANFFVAPDCSFLQDGEGEQITDAPSCVCGEDCTMDGGSQGQCGTDGACGLFFEAPDCSSVISVGGEGGGGGVDTTNDDGQEYSCECGEPCEDANGFTGVCGEDGTTCVNFDAAPNCEELVTSIDAAPVSARVCTALLSVAAAAAAVPVMPARGVFGSAGVAAGAAAMLGATLLLSAPETAEAVDVCGCEMEDGSTEVVVTFYHSSSVQVNGEDSSPDFNGNGIKIEGSIITIDCGETPCWHTDESESSCHSNKGWFDGCMY